MGRQYSLRDQGFPSATVIPVTSPPRPLEPPGEERSAVESRTAHAEADRLVGDSGQIEYLRIRLSKLP